MKNQLLAPVISLLLLGVIMMAACSKKSSDPAPPAGDLPMVTTSAVTGIQLNAALAGGTVTSDGGLAVTHRGVCWNKSANPDITGNHTDNGSGTGLFTSPLTGLDTNTTYYLRAYATNSKGTGYGDQVTFKTLKEVVYGRVMDIDSNWYDVIRIGYQYWTKQNLRVTRYRNGDAIPNVIPDANWKNLTTGAWCLYDNQAGVDTVYGKLYNWHALTDARGLCPANWHVPSDAEWQTLASFLGGPDVAGAALKSTGTIEESTGLWYFPNTGATNESNFTGLPGGYRINYGNYYSVGNVAYIWSASDTAAGNAWNYVLDANNTKLLRNFNFKTNGMSVRCVRD